MSRRSLRRASRLRRASPLFGCARQSSKSEQIAIYAPFAAVAYAGVKIVEGVIRAWKSVTDFLGSITLADVGTAIMQGWRMALPRRRA